MGRALQVVGEHRHDACLSVLPATLSLSLCSAVDVDESRQSAVTGSSRGVATEPCPLIGDRIVAKLDLLTKSAQAPIGSTAAGKPSC